MTAGEARRARAETRWQALLAEQADLAPAVDLQRTLIGRVLDAVDALGSSAAPDLPPFPHLADKLRRGVPVLWEETVAVPAALLEPLLIGCADDLAAGGAAEVARRIRDAIAARRLDGPSVLAASLARDQCAFRTAAVQLDVSPDLLWMLGELAVSPLAHSLAASLAGADSELGGALASWRQGYCPICGSWPALAELDDGGRLLRCSFCATSWRTGVDGCPYCGEAGDSFSLAADPDRPDRRLGLCSGCGGYLKMVRPAEPLEFPAQAIEDLATADLDRMAMERGFRRPPLRGTFPPPGEHRG